MNIPYLGSIQVIIFTAGFFMALIAGPLLIPVLKRLKFGQTVRDDGPQSHLKKTGTPTMGGIIFLIPIFILTLLFSRTYPDILPLAFVTLGFGIIGFIDDFIKVVKKRKDGLYPIQKLVGEILVSAAFAFYITQYTDIGTHVIIPFLGTEATLDLAWLFVPFVIIVMLSITNGVNITDGLDGLAAGVTLVVFVFFTLVSMTGPEWEYVKVFSAMSGGACLGFLVFNLNPARVFMGDSGSLALGGALGAIAVMMRMPLMLLIVGFIYVIETLSVVLQVSSFKLRGKRIFKMAPLHHHFELSGWKETRVVYLFWAITIAACIVGLLALRIRIY